MKTNSKKLAVVYIRRSNAKEKSDSFARQELAASQYAERAGLNIVEDGFYRDGGVSGTKGLEDRKGLQDLFVRCHTDGVKVAIIENVTRLARDLLCGQVLLQKFQEGLGILKPIVRGIQNQSSFFLLSYSLAREGRPSTSVGI